MQSHVYLLHAGHEVQCHILHFLIRLPQCSHLQVYNYRYTHAASINKLLLALQEMQCMQFHVNSPEQISSFGKYLLG